MNISPVAEEYADALSSYSKTRSEDALHDAYEIGRKALTDGLRTLDIVRIHHDHLSRMLAQFSSGTDHRCAPELSSAATEFLAECLSPFDMTLDGYREVIRRLELEIFERKKAERGLRESEEHFRSLVENALDIVTILNEDATVRYESPSIEQILGYGRDELVGKNVFDFLHPDDRDRIRKTFEEGVKIDGYTVSVQFRFRHKDGTWHMLEASGKNLLNARGIRGILVNSMDITERIRLQERLDEAARQRADDLRNFARSIQQVQEEERHRISRELHDHVCQSLSALRLHLSVFEDDIPAGKKASLRRLQSLKEQIDGIIEDIRRISSDLRPAALDHFGLLTALRHLCVAFEKTHNLNIHLETHQIAPGGYGVQTDIALYRITQEALMNVAKHAKARTVYIGLSCTPPTLMLKIRDDGAGFRTPGHGHQRPMGLIGMQERAELLGGTFSVQSAPGKGVTLCAELPLHETMDHEENQALVRR